MNLPLLDQKKNNVGFCKMDDLPEVAYLVELDDDEINTPTGGIWSEYSDCSFFDSQASVRYVRDEVIGWEAVRKQLPDLLIKWGWMSTDLVVQQPDFIATFECLMDDGFSFRYVIRIYIGGLKVHAVEAGTSDIVFSPCSINDLKAILRSINPVLVGEG